MRIGTVLLLLSATMLAGCTRDSESAPSLDNIVLSSRNEKPKKTDSEISGYSKQWLSAILEKEYPQPNKSYYRIAPVICLTQTGTAVLGVDPHDSLPAKPQPWHDRLLGFGKESVPVMLAHLHHPSPYVRCEAIAFFTYLKGDAVDALKDLDRLAKTEKRTEVRNWAARAATTIRYFQGLEK